VASLADVVFSAPITCNRSLRATDTIPKTDRPGVRRAPDRQHQLARFERCIPGEFQGTKTAGVRFQNGLHVGSGDRWSGNGIDFAGWRIFPQRRLGPNIRSLRFAIMVRQRAVCPGFLLRRTSHLIAKS
jgi:hypothetical protein